LVNSVECMMMHGLANPKHLITFHLTLVIQDILQGMC